MRLRIDGVNKAELRRAISVLPSEMSKAADRIAERAAAMAPKVEDYNGGPREVDPPIGVTTSEGKFGARATVIVMHPAGIAIEAKHALLARAAAGGGR